MSMPDKTKFEGWWGLQESSGTRYDDTGNGRHLTDYHTVLQGSGHVQDNSANFERDNSEALYRADESWQVPASYVTMGGWGWRESAHTGPIIGKGQRYQNSSYGLYVSSDNKANFRVCNNGTELQNGYTVSTSAVIPTSSWIFIIGWADEVNNNMGVRVYNTSGSIVSQAVDTSWGGNIGSSGYKFTLGNVATGEPYEGADLGKWDGLMEQVFFYNGIFTSEEESWMVNSGAGRQWLSFIAGGANQVITI